MPLGPFPVRRQIAAAKKSALLQAQHRVVGIGGENLPLLPVVVLLAAMALVFPTVILTMTMSGGAMGGGAMRRPAGSDLVYRMELSLRDAAFGIENFGSDGKAMRKRAAAARCHVRGGAARREGQ